MYERGYEKKRTVILLLVLFFIVFLTRKASAQEPCEIIVEMLTVVNNPDLHLVEQAINEIIYPEIGCTMAFREVNYSDHEILVNRMASGENRMDIIFCGFTTNPSELKSNGLIIGLGDLLTEYAPAMMSKCRKLMPGCYIDDDYYFVPGSLYPGTRRCYTYNASLLEEYNIPVPSELSASYDSLEGWFREVRASGYPGASISAGDGFTISLVEEQPEPFGDPNRLGYGVLLHPECDIEIVDYYETEEFRIFCEKMGEWGRRGYLRTTSLMEGSNLMGELLDREVAGAVGNSGTEDFYTLKNNSGDRFRVVSFGETMLTSSDVADRGLAVTSACEYPEKCVEFLNLVYTDQRLSNLMNYGIEGIHYEKLSPHIIRKIETEEGMSGYRNQNMFYGDEALNYQYYPETEDYYRKLSDFRIESCIVSVAFGYIFDLEPVRAKVTAVNEVIDLYRPGLMSGIVDIDQLLPEFIRELKEAGIDDIIAENQRQFDTWRSRL